MASHHYVIMTSTHDSSLGRKEIQCSDASAIQIDVSPSSDEPCFSITKLERTKPETRKFFLEEHQKDERPQFDNRIVFAKEKKYENKRNCILSDDPEVIQMNLNVNIKKLRFDQSLIHQWGVFTTSAIKKNEYIIEYVGELIRLRVVDKRQNEYELKGNKGSYIFQLESDLYIDATNRGGFARFINHSCDPNCDTRQVFFNGINHILIYAKRDIKPYEELNYDYRMDYETKDKRIKCLCGSPNCKKYLNWSKEAESDLNYKWTSEEQGHFHKAGKHKDSLDNDNKVRPKEKNQKVTSKLQENQKNINETPKAFNMQLIQRNTLFRTIIKNEHNFSINNQSFKGKIAQTKLENQNIQTPSKVQSIQDVQDSIIKQDLQSNSASTQKSLVEDKIKNNIKEENNIESVIHNNIRKGEEENKINIEDVHNKDHIKDQDTHQNIKEINIQEQNPPNDIGQTNNEENIQKEGIQENTKEINSQEQNIEENIQEVNNQEQNPQNDIEHNNNEKNIQKDIQKNKYEYNIQNVEQITKEKQQKITSQNHTYEFKKPHTCKLNFSYIFPIDIPPESGRFQYQDYLRQKNIKYYHKNIQTSPINAAIQTATSQQFLDNRKNLYDFPNSKVYNQTNTQNSKQTFHSEFGSSHSKCSFYSKTCKSSTIEYFSNNISDSHAYNISSNRNGHQCFNNQNNYNNNNYNNNMSNDYNLNNNSNTPNSSFNNRSYTINHNYNYNNNNPDNNHNPNNIYYSSNGPPYNSNQKRKVYSNWNSNFNPFR